ncbi:hypothetical protein [Campylobacter majalis]
MIISKEHFLNNIWIEIQENYNQDNKLAASNYTTFGFSIGIAGDIKGSNT